MDFTLVKLALRYCEMGFSHVNLAPHYCEMNFRPVKMIFHVFWNKCRDVCVQRREYIQRL